MIFLILESLSGNGSFVFAWTALFISLSGTFGRCCEKSHRHGANPGGEMEMKSCDLLVQSCSIHTNTLVFFCSQGFPNPGVELPVDNGLIVLQLHRRILAVIEKQRKDRGIASKSYA